MYAVRTRTHEELSKIWNEYSENKKFSHYFTNHNGFRMIYSMKHNAVIIQQTLSHEGEYAVNVYSALKETSLLQVREIAKKYGCEEKTSVTQQIIDKAS